MDTGSYCSLSTTFSRKDLSRMKKQDRKQKEYEQRMKAFKEFLKKQGLEKSFK